jgi:hypothetical protein
MTLMHSPRQKTGLAAVIIYSCVVILLVAGTVQTAHLCGLQISETQISVQNDGTSSPVNSACAMCLLIQSVAAALVFMVTFSLPVRQTHGRSILQVRFVPILTSFQLYVRPPPAW